jgi:hypothetical protein
MKTALLIILVTFVSAAGQTSDVKVRQRMTMGTDKGAETTLYIKGQRMRNEMGGDSGITTIVQCDLKRTLTINDKTKTYFVISSNAAMAAEGDGGGAVPATPATQPSSQPRGGIVNVTNTITDTGERKQMFGFTARHIKTSVVKQASPEACDKDSKIETDGWYIDFQYAFDCPGQSPKYQAVPVQPRPGCRDEVRTKTIGTAKLGFPVLVTTTIYLPDGRTTSTTQEVLEISRAPLDMALFEAPQGYRQVSNMQEMYSAGTSTYSANEQGSAPSSNTGSSAGNIPASVASATTPKKAGVVRIGLITPKVTMSAGDPAQAAVTLRNSFVNYLKGPNLEVVLLNARVPSLALEEARQSQCDYVLNSSMTVKKGGGGSMFGRAIGNIAGSAAGRIPVSSEVTLEYKLEPLSDGKRSVSNTDKAKTSQDNQDVITGLVEKASAAMLSALAHP